MSIDSDIMSIRSQISTARSINTQLRQELYQLSVGVNNASDAWNALSSYITGTLANGTSRVNDSHEITLRAYELENEVEKMYALYKNIELANKKIRECKNRIYYEFSNYRSVRKIVEALLNNIETTFVSDKTLTKAVEINHLQLPDYWLTCALLAIMAWKNDDKVLAERAVQRACKLDLSNTSIFFFAFHLRIEKNDTALKWFEVYSNCEHTGEDQSNVLLMFSIVCSSLKEKADDALVDSVSKFINRLLDEIKQNENYSEEKVIQKIMHRLNIYKVNDPVDYPVLSQYCTEKDYLAAEMNAARTNQKYLDMILKTVNIPDEEKKNYLNKFIDGVIVRANKAEKEVDNEIVYNEYIISHNGNVEAAKESYDEYIKHSESEFDIINEMIDWIYNPNEEVGRVEKLKMFILTKDLQEAAITNKVNEYRNKYKRNLNVKINDYETNVNFAAKESESSKIDTYFKDKEKTLLAGVKTWPCFIWFGLAVLSVVGTVLLEALIMLVLAFAGIAGGILKIIMSKRQRENIVKACAIEANNTKDSLSKIFDEFHKYENEYMEYDKYFDDIQTEFAKL